MNAAVVLGLRSLLERMLFLKSTGDICLLNLKIDSHMT